MSAALALVRGEVAPHPLHDESSGTSAALLARLDGAQLHWLRSRWHPDTGVFSWVWGDNVRMCKASECRRFSIRSPGLCHLCQAAFEASGESDCDHWLETHVPCPSLIEAGPAKCAVANPAGQCRRPAESCTLCYNHYRRWADTGRPEMIEWMLQQDPYPEPGQCAVSPCKRDRRLPGASILGRLCFHHGAHWQDCKLAPDDLSRWLTEQGPAGLTAFDLWLGNMRQPTLIELLVSVTLDTAQGLKVPIESVRAIGRAACQAGAGTLLELSDAGMSQRASTTLRRWANRLDIWRADADEEWLRDSVRLAVVKGDPAVGATLPLGRISQPWLRQMMTDYCKAQLVSLTPIVLKTYVSEMGRLSAFLGTRVDHGTKPQSLTTRTMDAYATIITNDAVVKPKTMSMRLEAVGSILTQCQALGLARRYGLGADFQVFKHHHPKHVLDMSFEHRAFPDATFRFLLGADDLLGHRVIDLLRTIPMDDFNGDVAVQTLHMAANFGRRPSELYSLNADRIRGDDRTGQAAILYNNFKSGRKNVWLPIDARSSGAAAEWITVLRARYPLTPLGELALLPAPRRNPHGTKHVTVNQTGRWFRGWTLLLEQAIVISHIHRDTAIPIAEICQLDSTAFDGRSLNTSSGPTAVGDTVAAMLTDYRNDLHKRLGASTPDPGASPIPLFPCPITTMRSGTGPRQAPAVDPSRFTPLGPDWSTLACEYASMGLPGGHLGRERINPNSLTMRRFRHTYLQHLVDIGTDIFVVQELADHKNVQTTIDSYIRVRNDALREAVDLLNEHRIDRFGDHKRHLAFIPTITTKDVSTNRCDNPQVLKLGTEGCDHDRQCYDCDHYSCDPSYLRDIKAEIMTCRKSLQRLEAEDLQRRKLHHMSVLRERLDGWKQTLAQLEDHLDALPPAERAELAIAADIVWTFRSRARSGDILNNGQPVIQ